jgi:hypothetical protein
MGKRVVRFFAKIPDEQVKNRTGKEISVMSLRVRE